MLVPEEEASREDERWHGAREKLEVEVLVSCGWDGTGQRPCAKEKEEVPRRGKLCRRGDRLFAKR